MFTGRGFFFIPLPIFVSLHKRIHFLLISHRFKLSKLLLHITVTQTRSQLQSAVCRSSEFATYITELTVISLQWAGLLNVCCAE